MSNIVDMTSNTGNEQKNNNVSGVGCDILGSFRPTPVTMGCSQDIPETIHEESESRRESMVDAMARKSSLGKKLETLADIAQSSEESGNSSTLLSPWIEENQTGANNFSYNDSDLEALEMERVPVSLNVPGNNINQGVQNDITEAGDNSFSVDMDEVDFLQHNVMSGNRRIKPVQSQSLEKAVGFLLESKAKKNNKRQPLKRVKFNHV